MYYRCIIRGYYGIDGRGDFATSPPFLNRFTFGFHQNYLLFKSYKVSYNRKYPTLPVQFRTSQPQPLKLGRGLRPFLGGGLSPHLTQSSAPRPTSTSVPSGILIHPAIWPQQIWTENWGLRLPLGRGSWVPI